MKKLTCIFLLLALFLCGCAADTVSPDPSTTPEEQVDASPTPDADPTPEPLGPVDLYDGLSSDLIIGIDEFGRTFDIQAETRDREVGMFFWLWQGKTYDYNTIYDATKIVDQYGVDVLTKQDVPESPNQTFHFWGEPLWGYYDQKDEWVVRKQMELLANAGVDFIVFDTTNAIIYQEVYTVILKVISQMISEGSNPPKVAFYTHSASTNVTRELYNKLYKRNVYPEAWYRVDGKPFIIAYTDVELDIREARGRGDKSYNPEQLSQEILDFFSFRTPQWPSDQFIRDGFPWIEWSYPQYAHNGIMSVSVAAHPQLPMSFSLSRGNKNWGRGFDVTTYENVSEDAVKGTFFQSQWETAFKKDPHTVFVGGWNEWLALKSPWDGEYMMCDAVNMEFSRDLEMMKGGYNDAFYIQLIQNIRRYKSVEIAEIIPTAKKTIDIFGDISQWSDIKSVYKDTALESIERNCRSFSDANLIYTQDAARNDIRKVSVTADNDNFYFLIECAADITGEGESFMNLFIGTGELKQKGWEGYEYVINRSISGNDSDIIKLNSDFTGDKVGTAKVNVSGKYMQLAIPRADIGATDSYSIYFKVADNVENPSDIMDYYVSGKSFPIGRLSYRYLG